jgi:hypothetical protein
MSTVETNPFPPIECVCGEVWTQEMHTVCPRCARWPARADTSDDETPARLPQFDDYPD